MIEQENIYGVIYCLTNKINGKQYFGQTTQKIKKYLNSHKNKAFNNNKPNNYIHKAIKKYGWDNFKKEIFCECGDKLSLGLMEDFCIQVFNTLAPNGYNLKRGGVHGKPSEKTKRKISDKIKKWHKNNPIKKGENHWNYGKKVSEETKKLISDKIKKWLKNNPNFNKGKNHPNYGKVGYWRGKKNPDQSKRMLGENNPIFGKFGKENPMFGVHISGENHWNYGKKASCGSHFK